MRARGDRRRTNAAPPPRLRADVIDRTHARESNPPHHHGLTTPYPSPRGVTSATVGPVAAASFPRRRPPPGRSTPSPAFPSRTPREPRPEPHARREPAHHSEYEPARTRPSSTLRACRQEAWRASRRGLSRRRSCRRPRARSVRGPVRPSTRHPSRHPIRHPSARRRLRPRTRPSSRSRGSFRSRVASRRRSRRLSRRDGVSAGAGVCSRGRVRVRPIRVETPRRARARLPRRRRARLDAISPPRVVRRRVDGVLARFARGDTASGPGERSSCSRSTRRRGALVRVGRRSRRERIARARARRSPRARARGAPPGCDVSGVGKGRRARFGTEVESSRCGWTTRRREPSSSRGAFRTREIEARAGRRRRRWTSRAERWPVARFPWRVASRVSRATVGVSQNGHPSSTSSCPRNDDASSSSTRRRRFARRVTSARRVLSPSAS